jgi:hypothetical protein
MKDWQLLFLPSEANNNFSYKQTLALQNWAWPQATWFQKRLSQLRRKQQTMERERRPSVYDSAGATLESAGITTARLLESTTQQGASL